MHKSANGLDDLFTIKENAQGSLWFSLRATNTMTSWKVKMPDGSLTWYNWQCQVHWPVPDLPMALSQTGGVTLLLPGLG